MAARNFQFDMDIYIYIVVDIRSPYAFPQIENEKNIWRLCACECVCARAMFVSIAAVASGIYSRIVAATINNNNNNSINY